MKSLKHYTIIGALFVLITGTFSHFIYEWTGENFFVGLFTPTNESTWEHMKLIFFPMLIYSFIMNIKFKENFKCVTSSLAFGNLLGTFLIPIIFYTYSGILGHNIFILDIMTFVVCVLIAFFAAYKLTLSCVMQKYTYMLCILEVLTMLCFFIFTYCTPAIGLFTFPVK